MDHALSDFVGMMPWPRFADLVGRDVGCRPGAGRGTGRTGPGQPGVFSFDSEDGLKTIVAKAAAGDAIWFLATINRIAEILAARGDTDPVGARRARAVGILARPAEALQLLIEHQHDPDRSRHHDPPNGEPTRSADDVERRTPTPSLRGTDRSRMSR